MKKRYSTNFKPRSLRRYEQRTRRNFLLTIGAIVVFIYIFFFWALPLLIKGVNSVQRKSTEHERSAADEIKLAPPALNIPYEATNTASIKIKGYTQPNTKVEFSINNEIKSNTKVDDNGQFESDYINLSKGDNFISGKTLDDKGNKSLASKAIRVFFSIDKPKLEVFSPEDNKLIKGGDKSIVVYGKTDPGNTININGNIVIVNGDGAFSYTLKLNDGDNQITVTVTNGVGNSSKSEKKVTYLQN